METIRVVIYRFLQLMVYFLGRLFFSLEVKGAQNVPPNGGVLLASNHASIFDILIIGCSVARKPYFLGKVEIFKIEPIGSILKFLGGIPINRTKVSKDALAVVEQKLSEGETVVFYLEGTRSKTGELGRPKPGLGMVLSRVRVPVVPVYIHGSISILPKGSLLPRPAPVQVIYGDPVEFSGLTEDKYTYMKTSEYVMKKIKGLRAELLRLKENSQSTMKK